MGITKPTDALTGLALRSGEPVVALVLDRRTGGYPDAQKAAAHSPVDVTHMFEAASLPIRGTAGDYNDIEPAPGQASVRFALEMTGAKDWNEFVEGALDFRKGAVVRTYQPGGRLLGGDDPEPRILGLAVFSETSWRHLIDQAAFACRPEDDVAIMLEILRDAREGITSGREFDPGWMGLFDLRTSSSYTFGDGRVVEVPNLARCLDNSGAFTFAPDFSRFMTGAKGALQLPGRSRTAEPAGLEETLRGLAETQAVGLAMRYLKRQLLPSAAGGQYRNHREVFETSLLAVEQASASMLDKVADYADDEAGDHLQALLERMDAMRAGISAKLRELRDEPDAGPRFA